MVENRDWNEYNTKLVNRGRPSTYLSEALTRQDNDLAEINKGKVGSPYQYSFMLILGVFAIKSVDKKGYRQATGTVSDYLLFCGIDSCPNFRTAQWRIQQLKKEGIKMMIYKSIEGEEEFIDVIIDSTGMKSRKDGEYRSDMYGKIKEWKQLHIAISRKTHKILNMKVTKAHSGDANQFVSMMKPIVERKSVNSSIADGAYDSNENFEFCGINGIDPIIPVHISAVGRVGNKFRKRAIEKQLGFNRRSHAHRKYWFPSKEKRRQNQDRWRDETNFHQRSLVETVNSVFKGVFDESVFSKTSKMIEKELLLKAVIYNTFIV
jgi:hypothetical protein